MRTSMLIVAALAIAAFQAQAECTPPHAPGKVPDGASASQDEMVGALKAMKQYDAEVNAYGSCLEQSGMGKAAASEKQNNAVSELQAHAAKFNEQVRVFKKRS